MTSRSGGHPLAPWGVMVLVALAGPARAEEVAADAAPEVVEVVTPPCTRGLGLAGGVYYGDGDWERMGASPWAPTMSPMFVASCGRSAAYSRTARLWIGAEMAPLFRQIREDGGEVWQFATASAGVTLGDGAVRPGLHGTAGWTALGGGVHLLVSPEAMERGHLEIRASYYRLRSDTFQLAFLYNFEPKPKAPKGEAP